MTGSRGVRIEVDILLKDYKEIPDALFLPGGMPGAKNLSESREVSELVKKMNSAQKIVSAICASPALVLAQAGILEKKRATCYPGFEKNFTKSIVFSEERVVVDGNVITSRGPGSAMELALELVGRLVSKEKAESLKQALLVVYIIGTSIIGFLDFL
jgi:4-methyl-5(b-hydroxyethyl)-thiazole monophosphate biosynthesis